MGKTLKLCPFRVHGERMSSLTVAGDYTYTETFMPCMGEKCAGFQDHGDRVMCYRDNVALTLWEREQEEDGSTVTPLPTVRRGV